MRIVEPLAILLVAGLCAGTLSGCGKRVVACKQDNKDYVGAREMPPLKAPSGLETPDTRNALRVPPLNAPERIRGRDEPCLDAPPPFVNPPGPDAAPAAQQPQ